MITIQTVIDGIVGGIKAAYPDNDVYTENVEQGLTEPCFSVLCLNSNIKHEFDKRYLKTMLFCVHYFPEEHIDAKAECGDVSEELVSALEYITADGDMLRGTDLHSEIIDNVLSFFVTYSTFVYREPEDVEMMEELTHIFTDEEI